MHIIVRLAISVLMFEGEAASERARGNSRRRRSWDGRLEELELREGNWNKTRDGSVFIYRAREFEERASGLRDWIMFDDFMTIYEVYVYISDLECEYSIVQYESSAVFALEAQGCEVK